MSAYLQLNLNNKDFTVDENDFQNVRNLHTERAVLFFLDEAIEKH